MKRTHIFSLMVLVAAIPAAAASSFFAPSAKPCFFAGNAGYELTGSASADYTVRIDNTAVRAQPAHAGGGRSGGGRFRAGRRRRAGRSLQDGHRHQKRPPRSGSAGADLTIAVSAQPADYKIYVRSANFSEQDAAALFAVIWQNARKTGKNPGLGREFAERH